MKHRTTILAAALTIFVAPPLVAQEEMPQEPVQEPEQEPEQEPPQEAEQAPAPAFEISRTVIATDVQDREPMGADTVFTTADGPVFFYTVFEGDFPETTVEHVWLYEDEEIARVPLTVRGPRFRTWSSKQLRPDWAGQWTVKVVDAQGTEHATVHFTIEPGEMEPQGGADAEGEGGGEEGEGGGEEGGGGQPR